jgi:hypothetical protein
MGNMSARNDFYEPDEPVDEVIKAFQQGEPGLTRRPTRGWTQYLAIKGLSQVRMALQESATTVNLITS